MKEYTRFCQVLVKHWSKAKKIRLVQDNLNTHGTHAFYRHLPACEAFALAQKFEFFFTPKSASWFNMIEIEFSALACAGLFEQAHRNTGGLAPQSFGLCPRAGGQTHHLELTVHLAQGQR